MTTDEAIEILREQKISLSIVNEKTFSSWHSQTKSIIMDMFGFASEEYTFISSFSFATGFINTSIAVQVINSKPTAADFLERCITTIKRKELFKPLPPVIKYVEKPIIKEVIREVIKEVVVTPPKKNYFWLFIGWLKRRDILALIGTVIVVLAIPYYVGQYMGENKSDIKNIELRAENTQLKKDTTSLGISNRSLIDSLRIYTLNLADGKTDEDAKNDKQQTVPDIAHKKK